MKNLNYFLNRAQKEGWAMGQFNFSNFEILKAIVQAAQNLKSPLIVGTSEGESRFIGLKQGAGLIKAWREETKLPIFLNLDHGRSFGYIKEAVEAGYDAVHFDGSELLIEENIALTKKIVNLAGRKKVSTEGEIGIIGSASGNEKTILTNSLDALDFIKKTKVDRLAISIGNLHGVEKIGENPHLNLERLTEIRDKLGNQVFLVLHGGSGTADQDIKEAIKLGIVKVNISTDLKIAHMSALKEIIKEEPTEITPYKYLLPVIEAVQKKVEEKIKLFGSDNKI